MFSGPIKLTSNILSVAEVQSLIGPDPSGKEFLLFTPNLNTDRQVFYDVTVVPSAGSKVGVTGTAKTAGGTPPSGSSTNPSPPATI